MEILDFFDRWRQPGELAGRLAGYSATSVEHAIDDLVDASLLERWTKARARPQPTDEWNYWHPAAGLLHFSSKDLLYQSGASARQTLRRWAKEEPPPPAVKRYHRAPQVVLPRAQTDGEFPSVLLARRTWRRFSSAVLPLSALATVLALSCGVQHWAEVPGIGRLALKTYPSGGARHPLEVYVVARRVEGLASGIYHYAADRHRLERLRRGANSRQIASYIPSQPWCGSAAALLLVTAVFARTQWKYRFARAYRGVLTESGHLCQTICLTATWLGLAPFCTLALADSRIEGDLGIDGVNESVLYAAGLGMRPDGVSWAPAPSGPSFRRTANRRLA